MTKEEKQKLWIGIGTGVLIGGGIGFGIGHSTMKKKERKKIYEETEERVRHERKKGRERGFDEALAEAQDWIDIHTDSKHPCDDEILIVNLKDPDSAHKAINDAVRVLKNVDSEPLKDTQVDQSEGEPSEKPLESKIDIIKDEPFKAEQDPIIPPPITREPKFEPTSDPRFFKVEDPEKLGFMCHGELLEYPKALFFDDNGESYGETKIRARLMDYERDPVKLKKMWLAMGWGDYFPDLSTPILTEEELNNMDLSIDEQLGDEPEVKTIERQRYLDNMEKYMASPDKSPKIVPQRRFDEDCYLTHIYVDYYDKDNVFVDSTDMNNELDAFTMFGVTDGKDLFRFKNENPFDQDDDSNDPDIVHVENFMMNTIAEITRYHKSYESVKDGSAYFDGDTTEN